MYPAWFLLLYFYYCNILFLLFPLQQLDQLLVEQSHLFSELGLSDWKGERKAQNRQAFPDAADTVHPRSGCSEMVLQRAPGKTTTATGSLSAPESGAPPTQFPTRTTPEPNSAESDPQELSTSKKEIKGPPQAKMDFKAFLHNVRRCFSLTLKVLSGRDCWSAMQFYYSVSHCHSRGQDTFPLSRAFIQSDGACVSGHFQSAKAIQVELGLDLPWDCLGSCGNDLGAPERACKYMDGVCLGCLNYGCNCLTN